MHPAGGVPVIGAACQLDPVALTPGHEAERPGADRIALEGLARLRLDHHGGRQAEPEQQVAGGLRERQDQGLRVRRLDVGDDRVERLLRIDRARRPDRVEAELRRLGGERLAVVEFRALLEREGVGQAVGRDGPAPGELRLHLAVAVDPGQALKHVLPYHLADHGGRGAGRVEAGRLHRHADDEVGPRRGLGASREPQHRDRQGGSGGGTGQEAAARAGEARACDHGTPRWRLHRPPLPGGLADAARRSGFWVWPQQRSGAHPVAETATPRDLRGNPACAAPEPPPAWRRRRRAAGRAGATGRDGCGCAGPGTAASPAFPPPRRAAR